MAELIVPPSAARQRTAAGLARFLETERARDPRPAARADRPMHRDGTEFPVELTITRIALPGAADVHRLPARHHRPQAGRGGAARLARAARRGRRRGAAADPAQPPRRRAAAAHRGAAHPRPARASRRRSATRCSSSRSTSSPPGCRRSASSRAGCTRRCSPSAGSSPALEALALRAPVPVELAAVPDRRLPEPVEAAAYYVVAEALANVHKHAGARRVVVRADDRRRRARSSRSPTTASAAPTREGSGLRGLADRVEALGGTPLARQPRTAPARA